MVLCLVALPVFAVLSIFSVKYKKLTFDALECLFSTVTLRKCRSGLDDRIKADVTGTVLKYSPKIAKFVYKNYKVLSWIILIIFLWSFYTSSVGVYNYANYGNCNGPESNDFCVFDPLGENSGCSEADIVPSGNFELPKFESNDPIIGPPDAELTVLYFGCYTCSFTAKVEDTVQEVIEHYDGRVNFQFKTFYLPHKERSYWASVAAECAKEQGKYVEYHDKLFSLQDSLNEEMYKSIASDLGLDVSKFNSCYSSEKYKVEIENDAEAGVKAGITGTPTFFVNDKKILGSKPFKTFTKVIDGEL